MLRPAELTLGLSEMCFVLVVAAAATAAAATPQGVAPAALAAALPDDKEAGSFIRCCCWAARAVPGLGAGCMLTADSAPEPSLRGGRGGTGDGRGTKLPGAAEVGRPLAVPPPAAAPATALPGLKPLCGLPWLTPPASVLSALLPGRCRLLPLLSPAKLGSPTTPDCCSAAAPPAASPSLLAQLV